MRRAFSAALIFIGILASPAQAGGIDVGGQILPKEVVFSFLPATFPLTDIRVTSLYGLRKHPILGYNKMHKGIDFGAKTGTPVHTTAGGIVLRAGKVGAYGNLVEVQHGLGFVTRYAHLNSISVKPGQMVSLHETIGTVGSTGRVTGPHLHYEIRHNGEAIDPAAFLLRAYEVYHHLK